MGLNSTFIVESSGFRASTLLPEEKSIEWIRNIKNNFVPVFDGQKMEVKQRAEESDKMRWRCPKFKQGCKVTLVTTFASREVLRWPESLHSHVSDEDKVVKLKCKRIIKDAVVEKLSQSAPAVHAKVRNALRNEGEFQETSISSLQSIKSSLYRARKKSPPNLPTNVENIVIPRRYQVTSERKPFLLYQ